MSTVAVYIWTYSDTPHITVCFYSEGETTARSRFNNPTAHSLYRLGQATKGMQSSINIDRTTINIHYNPKLR